MAWHSWRKCKLCLKGCHVEHFIRKRSICGNNYFFLFFSLLNKTLRKAFNILNEVLSDILRRKYPRSHMCEISFSVLLMAIREARLPGERPCWQLRNNTVTSANVTNPGLSLPSQGAHSSRLHLNWKTRPIFPSLFEAAICNSTAALLTWDPERW